jgi:hypothetical protein
MLLYFLNWKVLSIGLFFPSRTLDYRIQINRHDSFCKVKLIVSVVLKTRGTILFLQEIFLVPWNTLLPNHFCWDMYTVTHRSKYNLSSYIFPLWNIYCSIRELYIHQFPKKIYFKILISQSQRWDRWIHHNWYGHCLAAASKINIQRLQNGTKTFALVLTLVKPAPQSKSVRWMKKNVVR